MVAGSESALWLNMKVLTQPRRPGGRPLPGGGHGVGFAQICRTPDRISGSSDSVIRAGTWRAACWPRGTDRRCSGRAALVSDPPVDAWFDLGLMHKDIELALDGKAARDSAPHGGARRPSARTCGGAGVRAARPAALF